MWQVIEDYRQTRPDHMVEVLVGGKWYLGCDCKWSHNHTMGLSYITGRTVIVPN